jgi:Flp pilus assembly protein TadD
MQLAMETALARADAYYEAAFVRLGEGAFQDAVASLQRAVALAPRQPKYATALAKVYDIIGERERAGALLEQALRLRRERLRRQ